MSAAAPPGISAEEFMSMPNPADGSRQELVRGEVVTMPPPMFRHGEVQLAIGSLLRQFARAKGLGRVTVESGLRTEDDPDSVRGPDVAFWSVERVPADQTPAGYPDVPADLVVEVLSPSDTARRMAKKVREYLDCGVRVVWVVDPEDRTLTVYRQAGEGRLLWEDTIVSGEDVLPGFECPVGEFFVV